MSMNVALSDYKEGKLQKSTLYKIPESMTVPFEEIHANGKEVVNLNYQLQESQYGIYPESPDRVFCRCSNFQTTHITTDKCKI